MKKEQSRASLPDLSEEVQPGGLAKRRTNIPSQKSDTGGLLPSTTVPDTTIQSPKIQPTRGRRRKRSLWGGRTFRFNLNNFRLDGRMSLRRFSIVEASLLLMLALLASRGLGIGRQIIFNALFGTGLEANAFYAAVRLPDMLFNLVAGGTLSNALIPVFFSYEKNKGEYEAWRLCSLVFNVLLVILTILVIIGEFFTPAFVRSVLVPGYAPPEQELTTNLTRIMLLQPLILGLGTIGSAILNSKRQFLLPAFSIAVYNIGMIGGLLVTIAVPGVGIYGPTYGTLVAVGLQMAVVIPGLIKQGARYTFSWDLRNPGLHQVLLLLLPNTIAVAIAYIGSTIDIAFTSYLPDPASLAALHNAELFQSLPYALMSQAIGQALLPHLTAQAASGRYFRLYQTAIKVMGVSVLLTIPAALILYMVGEPLIRLIFEHGAFDAHSSQLTSIALIGFLIGLPGLAAGDLVTRAFYALKDAYTPLLTNILNVVVRFGLILLFLRLLPEPYLILAMPLALAGSATIEAVLQFIILFLRLHTRIREDKGMQRLQRRREFLKKAGR